MSRESQFFVVGVYDQPFMAHVVKSLLEQHSIPCHLFNEYINQVYPIGFGDNFAVKIMANVEDKTKIAEILSSEFENGK